MDIWRWVSQKKLELEDAGESRLASIMDNIPSFACDDKHDSVDKIFPEGLALAKQLDDKWVELFLRHWYLQSQVLHRENAKGMLSEAVDLLDFSHMEETKDCPQRICVVQDLTKCYHIVDGPGYAKERLDVAEETLAKIDGSWPCYQCVGSQLINALMDQKKHEEALERVELISQEMLKYDARIGTELGLAKGRALMRLGRMDEAKLAIDAAERPYAGESFMRWKTSLLALFYARNGEYDKAIASSLSFDEVLISQSYFSDWVELHYVLASEGAIAIDAQLLDRITYLAVKKVEHGAIRQSIQVYTYLAELAMSQKCTFSAKIAIEKIAELLPQLNRDLGAKDILLSLQEKIHNMLSENSLIMDDNVEDFLQREFDNSELEALAYEEAYEQWPSDERIVLKLSDIYENFHLHEKDLNLLEKHYKAYPEHTSVQYYFGCCLLKYRGVDCFFSEFDNIDQESLSDEARLNLYWLYAKAYQEADKKLAITYLEKIIASDENNITVLNTLAKFHLSLEDYSKSLSYYNQLIDLQPNEINHHWDRLVPATIGQYWCVVRESAKKIEIPFEDGEGEIYEKMEIIRVQYKDEFNEDQEYFARRTGPVSAKIISILDLEKTQRYGHKIVFNPEPLNRLDMEDEDGQACDSDGYYSYLYSAVATTEEYKSFLFAIDGVHPGDAIFESMSKGLTSMGATISVRSSDEYQIKINNGDDDSVGDTSLGLYAYIVTPFDADFKAINSYLCEALEGLPHPMIWPLLLEKIGDGEMLKKHAEIEKYYQL